MSPTFTECPFCAEPIRAEAILCKHCRMPLTEEAEGALHRIQERSSRLAEARAPGDRRLLHLSKFVPARVLEGLLDGVEGIEGGERRTVTVLFADLCGFTRMSEQLDPEHVAELVESAYEVMGRTIEHYDGIVDKFVGDAVVAIFGAPTAHEDDPERAVRAAVDLRREIQDLGQRMSQPLSLRAGINCGEVVVKIFGSDRRPNYTAIGDAVNLASRLEAEAGEGEILVSERVARRVKTTFQMDRLRPLRVKGKSRPVQALRVLGGPRAADEAPLGGTTALTEFVGRERELEKLERVLDHALAGECQAVEITGEAGVGKSRLVREFLHRSTAGRAEWFTGRCTTIGHSSPFGPVADLLRRVIGVQEGESAAAKRRKVGSFLRRLRSDVAGGTGQEPRAREVRVALETVLGLEKPTDPMRHLDPQERRDHLFACLGWTLAARARRGPVVYVFEDVHWADSLSLDFLDALPLAGAKTPMLILLVRRPPVPPEAPEQDWMTRVSLEEFGRAESAVLLGRVLSTDRVPVRVEEFVLRRAHGNSFFVEEIAAALRGQGILVTDDGEVRLARPLDEAHVPDTLDALLLSRLDRLPGPARRVAQCASVIGQEFGRRVLERVVDDPGELDEAVAELMASAFVVVKSRTPELQYMFRHTVTRDVTYRTLLHRKRSRHHLRVAQAIEELFPDRLDEHQEMLAHHWYAGGAGEKARTHLSRAAEKCRLLDANSAAITFTERLLEVLRERVAPESTVTEEVGETLLRLGRLTYLMADYGAAERRLREAMAHGEAMDLPRVKVAALRDMGDVLRLLGRPTEGIEAVRRALELCPKRDARRRASCHLNLGVILMSIGQLADARRELEHHLRWSRRSAPDLRTRYMASANHGLICHALGDLRGAEESLDRAVCLAEEMGKRWERAEALLNRALLDIDRGALREAQRRLTRSLRLGEEIEHSRLIRQARLALAEVAHHRGRLAEAIEMMAALLRESEQGRHVYMGIVCHLNSAQIRLAQDRWDGAQQSITEAQRLSERSGDRSLLHEILAVEAQVHARGGQVEQARRCAETALKVAETSAGGRSLAMVHRIAAEVALARGDPPEARRQVGKALAVARRGGVRREEALALAVRAETHSGRSQARAREDRERALSLAKEVGDTLLSRRVRRGTARSP